MKAGKVYESELEESAIGILHEHGWEYSQGDEIHRQETEPLIEDDLRAFLKNDYEDLSESEVSSLIENLRLTGGITLYHKLKATFDFMRDGFDFTRDDETKDKLHISYIDFDHPEKNVFRAVNQFVQRITPSEQSATGAQTRRPDLLLFVNGMPLVIIEFKNPADAHATIHSAWEQIHIRYKRDIPELMRYCVLSSISDGANNRLGTTFTPFEHYYAWKKVENEDEAQTGFKCLETLIAGAWSPERLLKILRDFVYFPDASSTKETEIVCRYPQFFATQLIFVNIKKHAKLTAGGDGRGGTYFGATGCGKTFTMLFLARQLFLRGPKLMGSPTILLIVDRDDLEGQCGRLFCSSTEFLKEAAVRAIESREDLRKELSSRTAGGFFLITIQKFCEAIGLLSDRKNIICLSDEAHRTQTTTGQKVKIVRPSDGDTVSFDAALGDRKLAEDTEIGSTGKKKPGAYISWGFAHYLREAFPNATYVGFTGTPIDDTVKVFGEIVASYTMREAQEDGITVPIKYEARLARVVLDKAKAAEIDDFYKKCADEGTSEDEIRKSREAMASLQGILDSSEIIEKLAADIPAHYEKFVANDLGRVQKAMIVCPNRKVAWTLCKSIEKVRPDWFVERRTPEDSKYKTDEEKVRLAKLKPVRAVNLVATRGPNDEKEMYDAFGDDAHRKELEVAFKDDESNFRIAIVVDMWITGFDVPSLTVMYNYKPLQKHTLVQTISRVNRVYRDKSYGLIVDYIGIRENMKSAMKQYGADATTPVDDLETSYAAFTAELKTLQEMLDGFNASPFFGKKPFERMICLQEAAEFVQRKDLVPEKEDGKKSKKSAVMLFRGHVRRLKVAFSICQPADRLNTNECIWAEFFMSVATFIAKATDSPHSLETMNETVAQMIKESISCSEVETVLNATDAEDIFSKDFWGEIENAKLPVTKFQILCKLLSKAIQEYAKTNKVMAQKFADMLQKVVDEYNTRDNLVFTNDVASATINDVNDLINAKVKTLTGKLKEIFEALKKDKAKFKELGITFEEKAFLDILIEIRDREKFQYDDAKCLQLAHDIKALVDGTTIYADFLNNQNLTDKLNVDLATLLYNSGYPPKWSEEIFEQVLGQVKNYKGNNPVSVESVDAYYTANSDMYEMYTSSGDVKGTYQAE